MLNTQIHKAYFKGRQADEIWYNSHPIWKRKLGTLSAPEILVSGDNLIIKNVSGAEKYTVYSDGVKLCDVPVCNARKLRTGDDISGKKLIFNTDANLSMSLLGECTATIVCSGGTVFSCSYYSSTNSGDIIYKMSVPDCAVYYSASAPIWLKESVTVPDNAGIITSINTVGGFENIFDFITCDFGETEVNLKSCITDNSPHTISVVAVSMSYYDSTVSGVAEYIRSDPAAQLESIYSENGAYIDSGIAAADDIRLDVTFEIDSLPESGGYTVIAGARNGSSGCVYVYINSYGYLSSIFSSSRTNNAFCNILAGTKYTISINSERIKLRDETVQISTTPFENGYNIYLFGGNNADTLVYPFAGKIYDVKIYKNEVLVRDLVPAKDYSDAVCMFDSVTGEYFYACNGNFLKTNSASGN